MGPVGAPPSRINPLPPYPLKPTCIHAFYSAAKCAKSRGTFVWRTFATRAFSNAPHVPNPNPVFILRKNWKKPHPFIPEQTRRNDCFCNNAASAESRSYPVYLVAVIDLGACRLNRRSLLLGKCTWPHHIELTPNL